MGTENQPVVIPGSQRIELQAPDGWPYALLVAIPSGPAPASGYPVIWLLDGQSFFGTVTDALRLRSARQDATGVPPAVVVGVAPGGSKADQVGRRLLDFTPAIPVAELPSAQPGRSWGAWGGAGAFGELLLGSMRQVVGELAPVDQRRQMLLGHSLAGLFGFDLLCRQPTAFSNWQLISPSLWWLSPSRQDRYIKTLAEAGKRLPGGGIRVGLSAGGLEDGLAPWEEDLPQAASVLSRRRQRRVVQRSEELAGELGGIPALRVSQRTWPDQDHASVAFHAIGSALRLPFSHLK